MGRTVVFGDVGAGPPAGGGGAGIVEGFWATGLPAASLRIHWMA